MVSEHTSQHFSSHHHSVVDDEPDHPPIKLVFIIVISIFLFVAFVWVAGYAALSKYAAGDDDLKFYGMASPQRLEYVKQQTEILNTYKKLDNGFYQIPISSAMEQIVKQNNK